MAWSVGGTPPGFNPQTVRRIKFPKDPTDVTPVTGDFTGTLKAIDCDALTPNVAPIVHIQRNDGQPSDLSALTTFISPDGTRVTTWLAEGTVGFEYLVSLTVQSVDGQIFTRSYILPVNYR